MNDDGEASARDEAVALTYTPGDTAPRVAAKGRGLIAREIVERAQAAGVFVHESPELVGLLMQVDLDDRIPPALYVAIAELLAWLYSVEHGSKGSTQGKAQAARDAEQRALHGPRQTLPPGAAASTPTNTPTNAPANSPTSAPQTAPASPPPGATR